MWKLIVICSEEVLPRVRETLNRYEDAQTERAGDRSLEYLFPDKRSAATAGRKVKKRLRKEVTWDLIPR